MNIPIIYEDDELLIINKPVGITVNKSETTVHEVTVQDWAEEQFRVQNLEFRTEQGDFYNRGGVVHRLDKETSGVLILAKNPESFAEMQRQFKEREVKKVYVALAHGRISPAEGEINAPVGRLPWNRYRFGILPGGRESRTLYKVLKEYREKDDKDILSLIELYPQSGRTHQIRVHLKYIGHPIFSDFLYAGRKTARKDRKILPRVFLHASKINLIHPHTKKVMSFEATLPQNLQDLLEKFQEVV